MSFVINYNELKTNIRTFDLLFFQGQQIFSKIVRCILCMRLGRRAAKFSHIGIIIRGDNFPKNHPYYSDTNIYVWESTSSLKIIGDGISDVDGKKSIGVQLRNLDDVVYDYYKKSPDDFGIYWSKLKKRYDISPLTLVNLFEKHNGKNYEINIFNVFAALFPCLRPIRECCVNCCHSDPNKYLFCSELAAVVYKDVGILDENVETFDVVPSDFLQKDEKETFDEDGDIKIILEKPLCIVI